MKRENRLKNITFNERGITLIALVITIIILLILAGITINLALAPDGIVERAQIAGKEYKEEQDKELEGLEELGNKLNQIIDAQSKSEVKKEIEFYIDWTDVGDGIKKYTALDGMTWSEWIDSEYGKDSGVRYREDDPDYVFCSLGRIFIVPSPSLDGDDDVYVNDKIINGKTYYAIDLVN